MKFSITHKFGYFQFTITNGDSVTTHLLSPEELLNLDSEASFFKEQAEYIVKEERR